VDWAVNRRLRHLITLQQGDQVIVLLGAKFRNEPPAIKPLADMQLIEGVFQRPGQNLVLALSDMSYTEVGRPPAANRRRYAHHSTVVFD